MTCRRVLQHARPFTITGTATDDDGNPATDDGVVALVEVSVDGGQSWKPASGTDNWSYSWTPRHLGTFEVLARAIDDSLNLPSAQPFRGKLLR